MITIYIVLLSVRGDQKFEVPITVDINYYRSNFPSEAIKEARRIVKLRTGKDTEHIGTFG